jgi:hypothetical protein
MKTVAPRWLAVSLLPVLAAALYMVNTEVNYLPVRLANARHFDGLSSAGALLGVVFGPVVTALLFAYPLGRVYARQAALAALAIIVPTVAYGMAGRLDDLVQNFTLVIAFASLALWMPVVATLAARAMARSRLAVASEPLPGVAPAFLKGWLLPLLVLGFFILRDLVQPVAWDLAVMPVDHTVERASLLVMALLGPALVALVLAYPVARIYERHAVRVGLVVAAPTALYWAKDYGSDSHTVVGWIIFVVHIASLAALLAVMAGVIRHRLGESRLRVVSGADATD